jgi:hypothetical protein
MKGATMNKGLDRRRFLQRAVTLTAVLATKRSAIAGLLPDGYVASTPKTSGDIFVSPDGNDTDPGTEKRPLRTLSAAQGKVRLLKKHSPGPFLIYLRTGIYYLPETLVFTPLDSGKPEEPIVYSPYPGEKVTLSGGTRLHLKWKPYRDGIMMASVPAGTQTDQLFVDGKRQILARYPNYDPKAWTLGGTSADAFSLERARRWAHPEGGYIHALHGSLWGSLHYRITGKDASGNITYDGGWQNNQPRPMHKEFRFVENIFEELDAPGEWFLDEKMSRLYYYPPKEIDLENAVVESVRLKHIIEFRGTETRPVRAIEMHGFTFQHTSRTFMETREPLLRSDWRVYRGGALLFDGVEDCRVDGCFFDQLGGNAIFVSNYNRRVTIARCHIADAGASGVCFVGNPDAVRSPLFEYKDRQDLAKIDRTPGPRTNQYPKDCRLEDTLIYRTGRVEKQTVPVEISMASFITVSHCSAYDLPRAGINIGDGTWGGHRIEYCDVFDTVKETGDSGSFNSWGRDRWWGLKDVDFDTIMNGDLRDLPVLDTVDPIVIADSRWSCKHGFDIDLDDGSSNYRIYNNLCLNGGIKLREGFFRDCQNNITVDNTVHQHVWFNDSEDLILHNIVFTPYRPVRIREWTKEIDFNLLHVLGKRTADPAVALQEINGQDAHSIEGDARFMNPATGDYRVKEGSPAFDVGFANFDMENFGVQDPSLRALARRPTFIDTATPYTLKERWDHTIRQWRGASLRNLVGQDEVSAFGAPGEMGVLVISVPSGIATNNGLQKDDLILSLELEDHPSIPIYTVEYLLKSTAHLEEEQSAKLGILRHQQNMTVNLPKR